MENEPTTPDNDDTLLGDADDVDHPSIEEQLDDKLEEEKDEQA